MSVEKQPWSAEQEAEWIRRAQAGDEAAFGELMQAHHERVFRLVWSVLRHEHDARDVAQEVWLSVWQQLSGFRGGSKFSTWLHAIAVRRAIDHLRKRRRWWTRWLPIGTPDEDESALMVAEPADTGEDGREQLEQAERMARLRAALEALPPRHRAVLAMRELEELSYEEIAQALRLPVGTVMSRLYHARRLLAQKLGDKP